MYSAMEVPIMKQFLSSQLARIAIANGFVIAAVAALVAAPDAAHAAAVVPEAGTMSLFGAVAVPLVGMAVAMRNRRKK